MHILDFYTQYSQFYILDKGSPQRTDSDQFWTEEASKDRLAIEEGVLGVGTQCYGPVKATVVIRESENQNFDILKYDHIVEGSLQIKSGTIQIVDCPTSSIEFQTDIPIGDYRVRVYSLNLNSVVGDEGNDSYEIEIWPGKLNLRKVIKRYSDN
ncbi:MAG: hypothetical protein J0M10_06660 [Chitinophagales bacterium]|nr:hypothetical protein [Chitinophagales bacterium]